MKAKLCTKFQPAFDRITIWMSLNSAKLSTPGCWKKKKKEIKKKEKHFNAMMDLGE